MLMRWQAATRTLHAYTRARWLLRRLRTREALLRYRERALTRFLAGPAARVPAGAPFAGKPLSDWPVMDKATLMSSFDAYNALGIDTETMWTHYRAGTAPAGCAIGASTGTSGNRGLYIVSDAERYRWLGVLLSRTLTDVLWRRHRVAVILPTDSRLYAAGGESGRLAVRVFGLADGVAPLFAPLEAFDPSVLVAPPAVLRALADESARIRPERVYSAAEVLDATDRASIEGYFARPLREIYMATEGLIAVSCEHGRLHVLDDHLALEYEPVGQGGLVAPLITDFSRTTQVMVRYRLNDLLALADPCACGSPHQAIAAVHGRVDDMFRLAAPAGERVMITPDVIRNAVIDADRRITDFRVVQTGLSAVSLVLPPEVAPALESARAALTTLFHRCGVYPVIAASVQSLSAPSASKRRRVIVELRDDV